MVCQMELTSLLLTAASFVSLAVNEMKLAAELIDKAPDHSMTLIRQGFLLLGIVAPVANHWDRAHSLLPLKKGTRYRVEHKRCRSSELVELTTSPQDGAPGVVG